MGYYTQLCFKDRKQIYTFLSMGKSINTIVQRLGRHRATSSMKFGTLKFLVLWYE